MKRIFISLIAISIFTVSCRKKGCTDSESINFNSEAKKSDGSCEYLGYVWFWFDQSTSDSAVSANITDFSYFLDGDYIGSLSSSDFAIHESFGAVGTLSVHKNLGVEKSAQFDYFIKDQNENIVWSGEIVINANSMTEQKIMF